MVQNGARLCGRTARCAVEAMRMRDEAEFSRELARIFRKNGIDGNASLFGYSEGDSRKPRIAPPALPGRRDLIAR